jgi:hypothetical protein
LEYSVAEICCEPWAKLGNKLTEAVFIVQSGV